MYKHVLIPVELHTDTDYGRTLRIAKMLSLPDGKITLLHVVEPIPVYAQSYIVPDFEDRSLTGAREELAKLAKELAVENTAVELGSAGRSIVDWADKNDADCIVISSHKPGLSNLFLGSTATWVVKHSPLALHVLR